LAALGHVPAPCIGLSDKVLEATVLKIMRQFDRKQALASPSPTSGSPVAMRV
jgi:hypothetical protein